MLVGDCTEWLISHNKKRGNPLQSFMNHAYHISLSKDSAADNWYMIKDSQGNSPI